MVGTEPVAIAAVPKLILKVIAGPLTAWTVAAVSTTVLGVAVHRTVTGARLAAVAATTACASPSELCLAHDELKHEQDASPDCVTNITWQNFFEEGSLVAYFHNVERGSSFFLLDYLAGCDKSCNFALSYE